MTARSVVSLSLDQRIRLVCKGLLLFQWWFKLGDDTESVLPKAFLDAVTYVG
jgi:hypothetical protein